METAKYGNLVMNVHHWTSPLPEHTLAQAREVVETALSELPWWEQPDESEMPSIIHEIAELLTVNPYKKVVRLVRQELGLDD